MLNSIRCSISYATFIRHVLALLRCRLLATALNKLLTLLGLHLLELVDQGQFLGFSCNKLLADLVPTHAEARDVWGVTYIS